MRDEGIILKTTDGGGTWISKVYKSNCYLNGVFFTGKDIGTIVGLDKDNYSQLILRTTNGGSDWIRHPNDAQVWLEKVFFTDENKGTVIGYNGLILRTSDGGLSWQQQTIEPKYSFNNVFLAIKIRE